MTKKAKENLYLIVLTSIITIIVSISILYAVYVLKSTDWFFEKIGSLFSWPNCIIYILVTIIILELTTFRVKKRYSPSINELNQIYDNLNEEYIKQKQDKENQKDQEIKIYVMTVMAPYMKSEQLKRLQNNISLWKLKDRNSIQPVITDGSLSALDLRHLAWNIGERLGWSGTHRAIFIKLCFPFEMKDLEIESIRRNLRQKGKCIIDIDIPNSNNTQDFGT